MPLESSRYELEPIDAEQFARLTKHESHSIEGQTIKMRLIEKMINERWTLHNAGIKQSLMDRHLPTVDLEKELKAQLQPIHIHHLDLGDGRFNLIVEKGEGDDDPESFDKNVYRVLIPAHIDTVDTPGAPRQLVQDPDNADHWKGLGVYDMGAGVLNNIALASTVVVPDGMKVYFLFSVDEEEDSVGAREFIRQWHSWKHIDCVLSSEIGPLKPLADDDPKMRLIVARRGRRKFLGSIKIAPEQQGHGAEEGAPNASAECVELLWKLRDRFLHGFEGETAYQRTHALLGSEQFDIGRISVEQREGYFVPHQAKFDFSVITVPPNDRDEVGEMQRFARGIAKRGKWKQRGIDMTVVENRNESSYPPYEMPVDHQVVQIAADILQSISGIAPDLVGAPSVADECDYAAGLLHAKGVTSFAETKHAVITIPPNGDEAHHADEWVSKQSIARVREAMRRLIEEKHGLIQMHSATPLNTEENC